MLADDLVGAHLGGLGKGDLLLEPGGADHALRPLLVRAQRALDHVAHAVHEPDREVADASMSRETGSAGTKRGWVVMMLLPEPDSPTRAVFCPALAVKLMSWSTSSSTTMGFPSGPGCVLV